MPDRGAAEVVATMAIRRVELYVTARDPEKETTAVQFYRVGDGRPHAIRAGPGGVAGKRAVSRLHR